MYKLFFKRFIDVVVSLLVILVLSPLIIILTIGLFFVNNGKPFFYQTRPGKNEKTFSIIKFKSMNDQKDKKGNLLPDKDRITKIGAFVRKYSLDELPQLFNVLIGNMSLVGPRPLLVEYLELYNAEQKRRHQVTPGITGWAQINGRNAIDWNKKLALDVWYVDNLSFLLDIKILFLTFYKVIKSENIDKSEDQTAQKFTGN